MVRLYSNILDFYTSSWWDNRFKCLLFLRTIACSWLTWRWLQKIWFDM